MKTVPFERRYKRDVFSCGKAPLDNYILRNATKDVKIGACACFVMIDDEEQVIAYYTLSTESIPLSDAPPAYKKSINYDYVPVILLGRLAVDQQEKGKGYGRYMLIEALRKSAKVAHDHIGAVAVIVDPIDEEATRYYTKYGFTLLPDSGRMFMSMKKIREALSTD